MAKGEKGKDKDKEKTGKQEALERALQQIEKNFGKGAIQYLGSEAHVEADAISTGALSLDLALGVGGMPRGRVAELFGPEGSGKTTLALHIAANAQKAGGTAAFVDAEHALDPTYARKLGVNLDSLLVSQPDSGEQALDIVELLVKSNAVDVVIVDSVAALVPRVELEGGMGDQQVGLQARLMSKALRKLSGAIHKSRALVIFLNQIRMKIGVMFGSPETTPGGRALKFYASIRIDVRRIGSLKDGEKIIGNIVRAKVVKNKVAPPFRKAEFDLMFNRGISWTGTVLDLAISDGLITKKGSWFSMGETQLGQGRERTRAFFEEHPDITAELAEKVKAAYYAAEA